MWKSEKLYFDGDSYFESLLCAIEQAKRSIELESYTFELDPVGASVLDALVRASRRGVAVRLMVDGFGSLRTVDAIRQRLRGSRVRFHVYHPVRGPGRAHLADWLARLNRRNHRKVCIVDSSCAWAGSFNVSKVHCAKGGGQIPWRDTGVQVEGREVRFLRRAFERAWDRRRRRPRPGGSALLRLNHRRHERRANFEEFVRRIAGARKRVWLTTPYFVPSRKLVQALVLASVAGADVRLLIPDHSDVPGMPSVAAAFFERLLPAGVSVHLYRPAILHAKISIIDDWASVGSSNLNHRSLLHDLEADVVLCRPSSLHALERSFAIDLKHSARIDPKRAGGHSALERSIGYLGLRLRYWL